MAIAGCRLGGAAMVTASTSGCSTSSVQLPNASGMFARRAQLRGARGVAAGERDHLAAPIEAKGRKMDEATVVAADNSNSYHKSSCGGFNRRFNTTL